MGQLDAGDRDGCVRERLEPSHIDAASLDRAVVLLDEVVEILVRALPSSPQDLDTTAGTRTLLIDLIALTTLAFRQRYGRRDLGSAASNCPLQRAGNQAAAS